MPLQMAFRMIFPFQIYIQRMPKLRACRYGFDLKLLSAGNCGTFYSITLTGSCFPINLYMWPQLCFYRSLLKKSIAEANPTSVTAIFIYVSKYFVTQLLVRKMFAESPCNPCGWNKRAILHRMGSEFHPVPFSLSGTNVERFPALRPYLILYYSVIYAVIAALGFPGYSAWSFSFLLTYRI